MKRTTITMPHGTADILEREAHRRSTSISAIARLAIATYLGIDGAPRELPFANLGRSGHANAARDMEKLLEAEWRL